MISQIESDRARPSYKILYALAERFDVSLENLLTDVEMNLEYVSSYKMAKAMVAAKEYVSAIPLLLDILKIRRPVISEDELLLELSECYLQIGQFYEAEKAISKVQETAILRQDSHLIVQTYRITGVIEFHLKRYHLAVYHWQKALDEMEKMKPQDVFLKARILTDQAQGYELLGRMKDAIDFYTQAAALYEETKSMEEIAAVYKEMGQTYNSLQEHEKAAECSQRAVAIYDALENVYMSAKVRVLSAVAYANEGRKEEAMQMLESAIKQLQDLRKHEQVGIAYVELAKIQLSMGELEQAEQSCQLARGLLSEMHLYQSWGNRIFGKIEQQRGNLEQALHYFKTAAERFKALNAYGEWSDTMEDISLLKAEQSNYKEAYQIIEEVQSITKQVLHERGIVL